MRNVFVKKSLSLGQISLFSNPFANTLKRQPCNQVAKTAFLFLLWYDTERRRKENLFFYGCPDVAEDGIGHGLGIGFFETLFIKVGRAPAFFQGRIDGIFNEGRPFFFAEGITQQHGRRQDCGTGIGNAATCNIRRRSVDRFIETGQFADGRRRHHADGTAEDSRFVTQDIAEEVARNDDVELFRVEGQLHGAVVDVKMIQATDG